MIRCNKSEQKGDFCCLVNKPTATGSLYIYIDVFTQSLRYHCASWSQAAFHFSSRSFDTFHDGESAHFGRQPLFVVVVVVVTALNGCRLFASGHKRAFTENKYTSDVRRLCLFLLFVCLLLFFVCCCCLFVFILVFVTAFSICSLFARDHKRAVTIRHTYLQVAFRLL